LTENLQHCGNNIGSGHVCQTRMKNCKASHEIDDNAGVANARRLFLLRIWNTYSR